MISRFVFIGLSTIAAFSQSPPDWEKSNRETVRLPPSGFSNLPATISAELTRRGCTIPQVPEIKGPHNVVTGHFAQADQIDWAVLCSVNGSSSILLFRNGSAASPLVIETRKDVDQLQGWGGDKIIFSRQVDRVDKAYILEHYQAYGGPKPPPIDHEGINDIFFGKASVVLYLYQGKWLHLTGAD